MSEQRQKAAGDQQGAGVPNTEHLLCVSSSCDTCNTVVSLQTFGVKLRGAQTRSGASLQLLHCAGWKSCGVNHPSEPGTELPGVLHGWCYLTAVSLESECQMPNIYEM